MMVINGIVNEAWGAPKARDYISSDVYLMSTSETGGIIQLLGLLFVFVIIIVAAYYASAWIAKNGANIAGNKNIKVIEAYRIAPNKTIEIIKIADKYIAVAIGKDTIEKLAELDEDKLEIDNKPADFMHFSEVLEQVKKKVVKAKIDGNEKEEEDNK